MVLPTPYTLCHLQYACVLCYSKRNAHTCIYWLSLSTYSMYIPTCWPNMAEHRESTAPSHCTTVFRALTEDSDVIKLP